MLERQPPVGGVGPPPRRGGPVYAPFYKGSSFGPPGSGPPPGSVTSGPTVTAQSINIPRSPRLLITPSSPDNVGPALGRLGRCIGKLILIFFKCQSNGQHYKSTSLNFCILKSKPFGILVWSEILTSVKEAIHWNDHVAFHLDPKCIWLS